MKRFFKQYYAPNNASLAIVGDFDKAQAKALVDEVLRHAEARRAGAADHGGTTPKITAGAAQGRDRPRRAAARLHVVDHARRSSSRATPMPTSPRTILGGGRSSRLYKKLVYEKQIAQNVSVPAGLADPRFGVSDSKSPRGRATRPRSSRRRRRGAGRRSARTPPDRATKSNARGTRSRRASSSGLETLGGFGGVADRLNMYNHYLQDARTTCRRTSQRYRAVTPASVRAFANDQLTRHARVVVHAVPGEQVLGPQVPTPPRRHRRRPARARNRSTPTRRGAISRRRPGRRSRCSSPTPRDRRSSPTA